MFNHLEMTTAQLEDGVKLGYIVDAETYNDAALAEEKGSFGKIRGNVGFM